MKSISVPILWLSLISFLLLPACSFPTIFAKQETPEPIVPATPVNASFIEKVPVVRYGRYALIELETTGPQNDLLSQIIDLTIPALPHKPNPSVADAMRHVLLNSGYQLCHTQSVSVFEKFPLPVAHYRLGPISIREALSVLAGPGWHLQVDDFNRKVCFTPVEAADQLSKNAPVNEGGE